MQTFTEPKPLVKNLDYWEQRTKNLSVLSDEMIDPPIIEIITNFNKLTYCFTLQSCYGHFLYRGQEDPKNLEPLPITNTISTVEYRIAYIAFCVENNKSGKRLLENLKRVTFKDRKNIQFCCADWFWKRQVNSYALQVEPDRFKNEDKVLLGYEEAFHINKIRNKFFADLTNLLNANRD